MASLRPALFLDRDGTLIEDVGYPRDPQRVYLIPGAAEALFRLGQLGLPQVIISNQSGVSRGILTQADIEGKGEGAKLSVSGYLCSLSEGTVPSD